MFNIIISFMCTQTIIYMFKKFIWMTLYVCIILHCVFFQDWYLLFFLLYHCDKCRYIVAFPQVLSTCGSNAIQSHYYKYPIIWTYENYVSIILLFKIWVVSHFVQRRYCNKYFYTYLFPSISVYLKAEFPELRVGRSYI